MTSTLVIEQTESPAQDNEDHVLRAQITTARSEHNSFRDDVREALIDHRDTESWCLPGTNAALEDLDLEPIALEFTGTVTVQVDVTVRGADDHKTAERWLTNAISVESADSDVEVNSPYVECGDLDEVETG